MTTLAERIIPEPGLVGSILLYGPRQCSPHFVGLEAVADFAQHGRVIVLLDRPEDRHSYQDRFNGWALHRQVAAPNVNFVVRPHRADLASYLDALHPSFSDKPEYGLILNDVSRRMLPFDPGDHFLNELARKIAWDCAALVLTVATAPGRLPLHIADVIFELRDGGMDNGRADLCQVKPNGGTLTLIAKNTPTTLTFDVQEVAHV